MKTLKTLRWITVLALISCNEKIFTGNVNCDECYTDQPTAADLVIEVTISNQYPAVPITVFSGDVEDNDTIAADTAYASPYYLYVPVNKKYSVKAEYRGGDRTIYAVDGTSLKILTVTDACDSRCYVIENEEMDVRLKREFQ